VLLKWRRANPAAGTLPYPSRLCSLDWATRPHIAEGCGEVYGEERTFLPKLHPPGPPNAHICGTERDFREGGEYTPSLPPITYRVDGLPTCCGPLPASPPPPPAPPGLFCAESKVVGQDFNVSEVHPGGLVRHWFICSGLTVPGTYHVSGEAETPSRIIEVRAGASCEDTSLIYLGDMNFFCVTAVIGSPTYSNIYVIVGSEVFDQPAGPYSFTVSPGPCI